MRLAVDSCGSVSSVLSVWGCTLPVLSPPPKSAGLKPAFPRAGAVVSPSTASLQSSCSPDRSAKDGSSFCKTSVWAGRGGHSFLSSPPCPVFGKGSECPWQCSASWAGREGAREGLRGARPAGATLQSPSWEWWLPPQTPPAHRVGKGCN